MVIFQPEKNSMVAHWFQRPAVSAPIARQSQKYISSSQFAVLQFNKESAGISSPTKVLAYTTSTVWGWQQRKKNMFLLGRNNFFQPRCFFFASFFFTKMRRRRCRREFIWPFHFYFPDKCTCPPHHFFWAKFPVFSFLLFCLAFHGARWTPFQGPENKNVFVFVFFPFFFFFVFSNLRFFYPAPEIIYPLISGGPGSKL